MPPPKNSLDHLILFLPSAANNLPLLPPFITQNFTLTPGGTHADNLTANTLILLRDGVYIELICFIPSAPAEKISSHWWGPDSNRKGWADWCLTNSQKPDESWQSVKSSHAQPVDGARKRADGLEVMWAVTFPKGELGGQRGRGKVPFFCHDVTPRDFRVPLSEESTGHACGALGVQQLTVVLRDQESLEETRKVYAVLFAEDGVATGDEVTFEAGRVNAVEELNSGARIVLRLPKDDKEAKKVEARGFWYGDVALAAKATHGKDAGTRERLDGSNDDVEGIWVEYI